MKLVTNFSQLPTINGPSALTIGNFDGLHLGHQKILQQLKELASDGKSIVITYSNHPSTILNNPSPPLSLLMTTEQKIATLKSFGIDILILLEFTYELSQFTAEQFLAKIKEKINFSHLVLGKGATIGKQQQGSEELLRLLGKKFEYKLHIVDKLATEDGIISSSKIRSLIQQGNLSAANALLGRPFSFILPVISGQHRGSLLGYPTANVDLEGLCHPPMGVYAGQVTYKDKTYQAVINFGLAPTFKGRKTPVLEAHILNFNQKLYEKTIEISLLRFIRPEKKFASSKELCEQIQKDINSL